MSHSNKLTGNFGYLYPFWYEDTLPGDTWRASSSVIVRMPALLAPLMHDVDICLNFFQVPYRLLWSHWDKFVSGGLDGKETPAMPYFGVKSSGIANYFSTRSLADYLGVSEFSVSGSGGAVNINALPFLAYYLVWSQYFRDANLEDTFEEDGNPLIEWDGDLTTVSGPNTNWTQFLQLRKCAWTKDYFTSALPFAQRGDSVEIPLDFESTDLIVKRRASSNPNGDWWQYANGSPIPEIDMSAGLNGALTLGTRMTSGIPESSANALALKSDIIATSTAKQGIDVSKMITYDPQGSLYATLPEYASADINDLRQAAALQRWLETSARGGSRYIEQIYAHFGVRSSDARLQRVQYLGGYRIPIQVSDVMQTSQSTSDSVLGDYAGRGVAAGSTHSISARCEEFGCIIGVACVRPKTGYMQGIRRHLLKTDKYDYYFPEFAHLGEQAIYNAEIYAQSAQSTTEGQRALDTFGYTPRYAEYKSHPNEVHGEFKDSLDYWHLARKFSSLPKLNAEFVQCSPEYNIFPVMEENEDHFYMEFYNKVIARRLMPYHGIPSLM